LRNSGFYSQSGDFRKTEATRHGCVLMRHGEHSSTCADFFQLAVADSLCAMASIHLLPRNLSNLARAIFLHAMAKMHLMQNFFSLFIALSDLFSFHTIVNGYTVLCMDLLVVFTGMAPKIFQSGKRKKTNTSAAQQDQPRSYDPQRFKSTYHQDRYKELLPNTM
jgi:hypothetical protein